MMTQTSSPPPEELVKQWEREQERLRQQVVEDDTEDWQRSPGFCGLQRVGGVDLSFIKGDEVNACAQLVVLSYPSLEVLYEDSRMVTLTAPYVSGFLAFRETPFLLEALQRLRTGQPTLMPQIAALQKGGDSFPLTVASGKVLGKALRSCDKSSKPVYVSVGHKISLDTAVRLTHACCRYRVPEPIRQDANVGFKNQNMSPQPPPPPLPQADVRSREYLRIHFPAAAT
ncbi:endonuclease V isoform X4 [Fundulus heteroclitus]|uniref:endonuclease V isoform X4 n=1 Tax=Fundulus heteroclitus TaxID=8078 RepID=UPI00165B0046|nr:endonuclease V isoform X4 [Fundulus heteroclitus]